MTYLTTLLTLATLLSTQAATTSLVGGVRVSTDTTGTNTIAANVIVTNLNGGASRTAIMARDVQVTNAVKVLSLTGDRVVGIGTDKALTNTTVSIATLEALSTAGTNNWINSGTTNSTLAGIAYPWAVEVTNHVSVGQSGEQGIIALSSTNESYTVTLSVSSTGTLQVKYGTTNMLTLLLGANANNNGATTNFLTAAGYYTNILGDIWLPGEATNVLARLNGPFGTNLAQFNFNGGLAIGSNTIPMQGTSKFYAIQSYRDVALGDPGQTLVQLDQLNGGSGDILGWLINMGGASLSFSRSAVNGADSASLEETIIPTNAIFRVHNGQIEFTGTPSRIYWNSTTNTLFDSWGVGSPEGAVTASPGAIYRNASGGATNTLWVKESGSGNTGWINK